LPATTDSGLPMPPHRGDGGTPTGRVRLGIAALSPVIGRRPAATVWLAWGLYVGCALGFGAWVNGVSQDDVRKTEQLRQALSAARAAAAATARKLETGDHELQASRQQIAALDEGLAAASAEARQTIATLNEKLSAANAELAKQGEAERKRSLADQQKKDQLQKDLGAARSELEQNEQIQQRLTEAQTRLAELRQSKSAEDDTLREAEQERDRLKQQLAALQAGNSQPASSGSWLGVQIGQLERDKAAELELDSTDGALVVNIFPASPALSAGLQPNDVIVAIDNAPIGDSGDLAKKLATRRPNTNVSLSVYRDGRKQIVVAQLAARPSDGTEWQTVSTLQLNLRTAPDPTRRDNIVDQMNQGAIVRVLRHLDNGWEEVDGRCLHGSCRGYVNSASLNSYDPAAANSVSAATPGPSFDCSKAHAQDEMVICTTPELARLDRLINLAFSQVAVVARNSGIFSKLLAYRQRCGADAACIRQRQLESLEVYRRLGATVQQP
jgi:hypothetical protein